MPSLPPTSPGIRFRPVPDPVFPFCAVGPPVHASGFLRLYLDGHVPCDSVSPPIESHDSPDFSDRDRRDLYIRGRAGRSAADRAVRPSSKGAKATMANKNDQKRPTAKSKSGQF
jgi:hypothetical protein